ncbi:MAG: signal recognition particle-docking protein FtsY [Actinobacteria bacterium]|nr:signal recognition particle-docking protein FtsY [Actinomycetota bacterium]
MGIFNNINFDKLKNGLTKTRERIFNKITEAVTGKAVIDDVTIDEIEEILISSDIGFETSEKIIDNVRLQLKNEKDRSSLNIIQIVKNELTAAIVDFQNGNNDTIEKIKPFVILIVGVNGAGKTTTIGKLAYNFRKADLKIIVGAADTFRAAANEQLDVWAKRAGVEIIQREQGSDPSAVVFDTLNYAVKYNFDIALIDTAGRLHTKTNLMDELNKIKRTMKKILPDAPHETLLVIDGTTGQNAISQVDKFSKVSDINGLVITKLDGTAKGGVIFQICNRLKIPVKYIGVGEGIEDLQTFDPKLFVSAIFDRDN